MKIKKKRFLSILVSLTMMIGLIPGMSLTAFAADTTWDADQTISTTQSIDGVLTISSSITLTINEGVTLTVNGGIDANGKTLTVAGKGSLVVTGANGRNGSNGTTVYDGTNGSPGENGNNGITGNLVINGANVTVTGGNGGSGGNGGNGMRVGNGGNGGNGGTGGSGVAGTVTVTSGSATVTGGNGGNRGNGGTGYQNGQPGTAGTAGQAITGTITGNAEESQNNSDWASVTTGISTKQYVKVEAAQATVDKTALNDAITAAQTLYDSIKDNTDYTDIASTLNTAIGDATTVANDDSADQDAVDEAATTITTAKTTAVVGMINMLPAENDVTTSDEDTIEAVRAAYDSLDKTEQDKVDANTLKKLTDAEAALNQALFAAYKGDQKTAAENKAEQGDSDAAAALITNAKKAIDDLAYDTSKTLEQNKAAVDAVITQLTTNLANQRAADAVIAKINALPAASAVTTADKDAINEARTAYNALTPEQKQYVSEATLNNLTDAEAALSTAQVNDAVGKINALPAGNQVTADDKDAIEAARAAYNALTPEQQAIVNEDDPSVFAYLQTAEAALAIAELPAASDVTSGNKAAITAAREAYNNLTQEQQTAVGDAAKAKLEAVEAALLIAELPAASDVTTANKDAIEAARAAYKELDEAQKTAVGADAKAKLEACEVALAIAELPAASDVTTANKDAIEAARTAYDALDDTQKTAVGNDAKAKLENAEAALAKKLIEALPEDVSTVTAENKEAIEAARAAYNALNDDQKATFDDALKAKLEVCEVALAIAELPAANEVTANDKDDIKAARAKYDVLTPEQQATIPEEALKKLKDVEDKLLIIETVSGLISDETKATEVTERIIALPPTDEIKAEHETKVAAARMAYELLTDAQKALVTEETLNKLEAAEKKISDLKEQAALEAAKDSAIERLEVYAEARAKSDATEAEKEAYDKAVADGKKAIKEAADKGAVAEAFANAKLKVDAALAKINEDRAAAAAAAAEMAAADKALSDAKLAAEAAAGDADAAAANEYASEDDKVAIANAKAALEDAVKKADELPANATAEQKNAAAKAIEEAAKALNKATDAANINSAAAKKAAEEAATAAEQLAAAKTTANDRLDIYAEARAKADATPAEKEAFDKAIGDGKTAINGAADKDAVSVALTEAKAAVDTALAKIEKDRADAAAAAAVMAEADQAISDAKLAAEDAGDAAYEAENDPYVSDDDKQAISTARQAVSNKLQEAKALELQEDATAEQKNAAAKAIEEAVKELNDAVDVANINSAAAKKAAEEAATAAEQLAAAKKHALERLEDYVDAKAKADATKPEKTDYDKVVGDGIAAINAAADQEAVSKAFTNAKRAVDKAAQKIDKDRAKVAGAKAKQVKLKTATAKKNRKAIVTWKQKNNINGYQIAYSTSKKFTKKTTKYVNAGKKATKKTLKKLKAGKKYFVKVRTWRVLYNPETGKTEKVYGKWSNVKTFIAMK